MRARLVACMLALVLVCSNGSLGQDKKDASKAKGQLPSGWSKLGLSSDQKQKVYSIQTEYRAKRAEFEQKLNELRKQERAELEKVLTDEQKTRLREILLEKAPGGKEKTEIETKKTSSNKDK